MSYLYVTNEKGRSMWLAVNRPFKRTPLKGHQGLHNGRDQRNTPLTRDQIRCNLFWSPSLAQSTPYMNTVQLPVLPFPSLLFFPSMQIGFRSLVSFLFICIVSIRSVHYYSTFLRFSLLFFYNIYFLGIAVHLSSASFSYHILIVPNIVSLKFATLLNNFIFPSLVSLSFTCPSCWSIRYTLFNTKL